METESRPRLRLNSILYNAIWAHAQEYDLDPYLVAALVWTESAFNPHAVGDKERSFGLMQLNLDGAGASATIGELMDINYNLNLGCRYLRQCINAVGYPVPAISAYNQGITGWRKNGLDVNEGYVNMILARYTRLSEDGVLTLGYPDLWFRLV